MSEQYSQQDVDEVLADLILEGLVEVSINEDGERVFRLTERGFAATENDGDA